MPQDYFRALRDVALAINASLDPKDVLHKISEHTAQTMNCKACTIRLLDSTGHFLLPSAAYGLSATYMRKGPVEVKRSGLDSEVLSGKAIHLKDATSDGRFQYPESAKAEGLVSVLSAPLRGRQGHRPDPRLLLRRARVHRRRRQLHDGRGRHLRRGHRKCPSA